MSEGVWSNIHAPPSCPLPHTIQPSRTRPLAPGLPPSGDPLYRCVPFHTLYSPIHPSYSDNYPTTQRPPKNASARIRLLCLSFSARGEGPFASCPHAEVPRPPASLCISPEASIFMDVTQNVISPNPMTPDEHNSGFPIPEPTLPIMPKGVTTDARRRPETTAHRRREDMLPPHVLSQSET